MSTGKTLKAMFKCRLCGKTYHNGAATGNVDHIRHCFSGLVNDPMFPDMTELHRCGDGGMGVADFQGFENEK